jgi:hypothetical protein
MIMCIYLLSCIILICKVLSFVILKVVTGIESSTFFGIRYINFLNQHIGLQNKLVAH